MERHRTPIAPAELSEMLGRWVDRDLISAEQADGIRALEKPKAAPKAPTPPALGGLGRSSLISEALGYLGSVLMIAAVILITTWYWADMTVAGRLGLAGGAAALALAGGLAVPDRLGAAGERLRSVLWLVSAAAFAGFLGIFAEEILDLAAGEDVVLLAAVGTIPYAAALWLRYPTAVQQAALFGAFIVAVGSGAAHFDFAARTEPGLGIWAAGAAWFALGWAKVMTPQSAAYVLGGMGAVFGALATTSEGWGHVLALTTGVALITLGVLVGDHFVLGVGTVGTAIVLPPTLTYFLPGAVAVPLGLVVVGLLLVIVALRIARDRRGPGGTVGSHPGQ